jgi:hypothetical protein
VCVSYPVVMKRTPAVIRLLKDDLRCRLRSSLSMSTQIRTGGQFVLESASQRTTTLYARSEPLLEIISRGGTPFLPSIQAIS